MTLEDVDLGALGRAAVTRLALDPQVKEVELRAPEGAARSVGDPAHVDTIRGNLIADLMLAAADPRISYD